MNQDRVNQLIKFIEEDPNDPFPKYALALEYLQFDKQKSLELFEDLLKNHPDYIGTYYHAGNLFSELDLREAAETTFQNGIERATALNETHALKELNTAYLNFQMED